jgi:curved DNA-binding protein CbpA
MTYYEVLGVKPNDSIDIIKKEYRARVKKNHPDVQQSEEWKERATEYVKMLNEAYEVLTDPGKKAEYDLLINQVYREPAYNSKTDYEDSCSSQGNTRDYSYDPTPSKQSFFNTFFGKAIIFILVFGVGNLVLYAVQGFGHADEKAQMEEIKIYLDSESVALDSLVIEINVLTNKLNGLDASMTAWYDSDVDLYNANVDRYNSMLNKYNSLYSSYESKLDAYNTKVDQYNTLADEIGTEWYIVPVPKSKL